MLKQAYNPGAPGEGMAGLLIRSADDQTTAKISSIKSTDVATIDSILAASIATAKAVTAATVDNKVV